MLNPDHAHRRNGALLALLLTGCAPLQWQKAGTAEEDIIRDQTRCTAESRNQAMLQRAPLRVAQVVVDLIRRCMQDLGYSLQHKPSSP